MGASREKHVTGKPRSNTTTRPKGPSLASIRRNKALSTDGHTARFLHHMLKQLDLKSIDWQEVADKTGIPKGHAARMRYNRFKGQMEALIASEEAIAAKFEDTDEDKPIGKRKAENDPSRSDARQAPVKCEPESMNKRVKLESGTGFKEAFAEPTPVPRIKTEPDNYGVTTPYIKSEPDNDEALVMWSSKIHHPTLIKIEDDSPFEESLKTSQQMSSSSFRHAQTPYMNPWSSYSAPHHYTPARYAPHPLYQDVNQSYRQARMIQPRGPNIPQAAEMLQHITAATHHNPRNLTVNAIVSRAPSPIAPTATQSSLSGSQRQGNSRDETTTAEDNAITCCVSEKN